MLLNARSSEFEAGARNRFVKRICETGRAYALGGADGLARTKSRRWKGRDVTLLWADGAAAEKYARRIDPRPRLKELTIAEVIQDVMPGVDRFKRLIGPDWGVDVIEAEVEPRDLSDRLRIECVNGFAARVIRRSVVWMLEGVDGPGLLISGSNPDLQVLPVWSDREEAEQRLVGPFEELLALAIPVVSFVDKTLPWLQERNRLVAPEHFWGGGAVELEPEELRFRLQPDLMTA